MQPIRFSCEATLPGSPGEIVEQILDLSNWTDFQGFGILPGIEKAEFDVKTPEIVGSRIRVTNKDGSSHVEEICEWEPQRTVRLHMSEFSPPLSRLATGFDEVWQFEAVGEETNAIRSFEMHAKSALTWPLLWLISPLLKAAITRHLRQMRENVPA